MHIKHTLTLFALTLLVSIGCNSNPLGTVSVSGTVTLDGQPAEGISVTFVPVMEERAASGITDAHGRFELTTVGGEYGSGAMPGEFFPTFSKDRVAGWESSEEEALKKYKGAPRPTVYLIPQRYASSSTSGFEPVKVTKGEENEFTFELQSK